MTTPSVVGYLTNWGANTALEAAFLAPTWLGLNTDDPSPLGSPASELVGGGYARQPISFAASASRSKVSVNAQVFTGLLPAAVPYFTVWTALSGGHAIYVIQLATPLMTVAYGQVRVAVGDIAVNF